MRATRVDSAPMSGGDPSRVHGVDDGTRVLLPGLTRPEAEAACVWLAALDASDLPLALAEVVLPVVLTGGAGPYLLDADGALMLALAEHPALPDARVVMGAIPGGSAVGAARPVSGFGWAWLVRARVDDADRVRALDELDDARTATDLRQWADRWGGRASTLVA